MSLTDDNKINPILQDVQRTPDAHLTHTHFLQLNITANIFTHLKKSQTFLKLIVLLSFVGVKMVILKKTLLRTTVLISMKSNVSTNLNLFIAVIGKVHIAKMRFQTL